jgi:Sigma-70 region 2
LHRLPTEFPWLAPPIPSIEFGPPLYRATPEFAPLEFGVLAYASIQCFPFHAPRVFTYLALFANPDLAMMLRRFLAKLVTGNALSPAVSIERIGTATCAKEMAVTQLSSVVRYIHRIKDAEEARHLPDARLLTRFIADRDEAAFTALVKRHCSMVTGVCRRILADHHRAEDAAQATFFVLARKAASIRYRKTVASWLYGVAVRTAMKARARANLHPLEPLLFEISAPACPCDPLWSDL